MDEIRYVAADDHRLFLRGFRLLLDRIRTAKPLVCVGEASTTQEVLRRIQPGEVDLLFLDLNLADIDATQLIPKFKELHPGLRILCISMYTDAKLVREALKKGADGFLSKNVDLPELEVAIDSVMEGEIVLGKDISLSAAALRQLAPRPGINRFNAPFQLTRREREILDLVVKGKSNKDIAALLFISRDTVSAHRKSLMRKLNVRNASGLIRVAYDFNLI
ncbi:MAG: response regulator transcription factor [Saprospiraceae bacterium]|jgi:DNA-binding NarL/FixJ family response regulator|nr:response regulator transcription factor [Saprospiraceae bacterium]MBP9209571.1 response regulator transcription factor [Saprospiraceae bacterium]MBV6472563.1 Transcriptional regulatory protein DegU [Saprospiraceae bacterium]